MAAMKVTFLGQAGVLLEAQGERLLIDPYMSDNLNALSNGFWARGIPIPMPISDLVGCRAVVCTHEHPDHLDPVTVAALLTASRDTVLVAPAATVPSLPFAVPAEQIRGMRGENDTHTFGPFTVRSIPAAHASDYTLEQTAEHGSRWCSVVVEADGRTVFHAGDTVDYDGFDRAIGPVDVACVPINGRGREDQDIVGNMDEMEAADLCRRLPARHALAIHWDMFPVNPGDPDKFRAALDGSGITVHTGPATYSFEVD